MTTGRRPYGSRGKFNKPIQVSGTLGELVLIVVFLSLLNFSSLFLSLSLTHTPAYTNTTHEHTPHTHTLTHTRTHIHGHLYGVLWLSLGQMCMQLSCVGVSDVLADLIIRLCDLDPRRRLGRARALSSACPCYSAASHACPVFLPHHCAVLPGNS